MASAQAFLALITVFSIIFRLNASYVGTPRSTANVRAAWKQPFQLKCQYTGGDAKGQFVGWFKDGVALSPDTPERYGVETNDKESILTIKAFVTDDAKVNRWHVTTEKAGFQEPAACRFGPIQLKPSPQGIKTDRKHEKFESTGESVRRTQKESVHLTCEVLPEPDQNDPPVDVQWDFSSDGTSFSALPDNVVVNKTELFIDQISKSNRGYYRCTSNNVSFSVLLRVKDRLAALWPFVGIVCTVIFCVFVILLIEKRQKAAKKALAAEDDTQDQANKQLVRETANTDDLDDRKRTVDT